MKRILAIAAVLTLGGCAVPAAVWIPMATAGLGYAASTNNLAATIIDNSGGKESTAK